MRDAVALAYSGRIPEAREAAIEQASSEDPFIVGQGLEALAALGQQYGVRASREIDALLLQAVEQGGSVARRAFEAAASLESRALEEVACGRLERGEAGWEVLRFAGEMPSLRLSRALAAGWDGIEERLRDEALLTSRVMPVASSEENDAWGARALAFTGDRSEEVRHAALLALCMWRPLSALDASERALEDDAPHVRQAASELRAILEVERARLTAPRAGGEGASHEVPDA